MIEFSLDNTNSQIVSDDAERLILVDADDAVLGHLDKSSCHDGNGILHRAFSLFIFNSAGALLLQQRTADKRLWGGYWSNSCCSHPREGETMEVAVQRRCEQELGFRTPLKYLYKFEYQARFDDSGSEHELCSVFIGTFTGVPSPNPTEVEAWQWMPVEEVDRQLADAPAGYTPWFKMEWQQIREKFAHELPAACTRTPSV